jgi:hypothetical protein
VLPTHALHSPPLLSRLDWHPHGALLAVPTDDGVVLLARDTWEVSGKLQGEHKKVLIALFMKCFGHERVRFIVSYD